MDRPGGTVPVVWKRGRRRAGHSTSVRYGAMMPTELPTDVAYLKPVLAKLAETDPSDLHEDNVEAADLIESAVRGRVKGMDEDEARDVVQQDSMALQSWLQDPSLASSPGHFVFGHMLGMSMWVGFGDSGEAP